MKAVESPAIMKKIILKRLQVPAIQDEKLEEFQPDEVVSSTVIDPFDNDNAVGRVDPGVLVRSFINASMKNYQLVEPLKKVSMPLQDLPPPQEIERIQKFLKMAEAERSAERKLRHNMGERIDQLNDQINRLKALLDSKDLEIKELSKMLDKVRGTSSTEVGERKMHVDSKLLMAHCNAVLTKIVTDYEQHGAKPFLVNDDKRIIEIRSIFNLLLIQLNDFNSKNISVTRTLQAMTNLDVRNFIFSSFFEF